VSKTKASTLLAWDKKVLWNDFCKLSKMNTSVPKFLAKTFLHLLRINMTLSCLPPQLNEKHCNLGIMNLLIIKIRLTNEKKLDEIIISL